MSSCDNCIYIENKMGDGTCGMGNRLPRKGCIYFTPTGCLGVIDEWKDNKKNEGEMPEVADLINALNEIPNISAEGSSSNDKNSFCVWLKVSNVRSLYVVGRAIDPRYRGPYPNWKCCVSASDMDMKSESLGFCLESPHIGFRAYRNAIVIAKNIREFMSNKEWVKMSLGVK